MRAIIPVAGLGSRLRPHTSTLPKVLLNVGGKPILGHIIDKLISEGITKATFIYGYLGELIIDYVRRVYPNIEADFVEQKSLEGLGHAIYVAAPTFGTDELLIILGDTIFDVNLTPVFAKGITSLGVKEVEDPSRFGVALVKNGSISKLIEKPAEPVSNLALVGLYYITHTPLLADCLKRLVEQDLRTRGELQLTDALQMMIERGENIGTFPVEGWYDCGKPETLLATNQFLLHSNYVHKDMPGVIVIPPVYVAESARVENSVIGPFTTIGNNAVVSESVIKNTIIGNDAEISKALLENSIIGNNASIHGNYKRLNAGDSTEIDFY